MEEGTSSEAHYSALWLQQQPEIRPCVGAQARQHSRQQRAWLQIEVPPGLGLDCDRYKWLQNQSYVEVFFRLPEHVLPHQARTLHNDS